ncbi:MAG TPA: HNH endonuclease [Candidatus Sulfotelmatobacter sp.]|nr:HNH endonuclease [Candidatus Sulfotelmatobacter sp.]
MSRCLFCAKPLTHATPPEHILLDCLGGRLKSKRVLCAACNRHLGGSVDAAFARAVEPFRAFHSLPSGSRNRVPDRFPDPAPPPFHQAFALRSLAKMALLLWADCLGEGEMGKSCWDRAKAVVMDGRSTEESATPLCAPTSILLPGGFGPLTHRLWVLSDENGRVIGGASFYGHPGRSLELCESGAESGLHLLLLADPVDPARWCLFKRHQ